MNFGCRPIKASRMATGSFDAVFTVSVLITCRRSTTRCGNCFESPGGASAPELVLPTFGQVDDPRCVAYSYSHDYLSILGRLPCQIVSRMPAPLVKHSRALRVVSRRNAPR